MPFISTGPNHTLFIDTDDRVWVFGDNKYGQLGLGMVNKQPSPDKIDSPVLNSFLPEAKSVSASVGFSLVLSKEGRVWSIGRNFYGQLGLYERSDALVPKRVPKLYNIVEVSAGNDHSLMLDSDGRVWPFGNNNTQQLGISPGEQYITDIPKIKSISAGDGYSLLVDVNGHVWSFGRNHKGQLGLDHTITQVGPAMIEGLEDIVKVCAGSAHSLFLDGQGRVWGCGYNLFRELGSLDRNERKEVLVPAIIPDLPPIKDIAVGSGYSLVLDQEGRIWKLGTNSARLSTLDETLDFLTIVPDLPPIDSFATGALKAVLVDLDGNLWTFSNTWLLFGLKEGQLQGSPAMIPDVQVKKTVTTISPFINTTYPVIKYFLDNGRVTEFRTRGLVDEENSLLEFDLDDDTSYVAVAHYDTERDEVSEPSYSDEEKFYIFLKELIAGNLLQNYELRPDIYEDEKGNQALVFLYENEFYLMRVYLDENGDIHRPL